MWSCPTKNPQSYTISLGMEEIPVHYRIIGYGDIAVGQSWYFMNKFSLLYGCSSVWVLVQFIKGLVFRQIVEGFSLCFFSLVCNPTSSLFLFPKGRKLVMLWLKNKFCTQNGSPACISSSFNMLLSPKIVQMTFPSWI